MKIKNHIDTNSRLCFDMTPMIDCTFQLVIFFMLTLNYAQENQDERIKLPGSELAKPSQTVLDSSVTLQLTQENTVIVGGDEVDISELKKLLQRERQLILANTTKKRKQESTIIIRADRSAQTGKVQEIIQLCQQTGFERFVLRAKDEGA